jgi:hypothetical protein
MNMDQYFDLTQKQDEEMRDWLMDEPEGIVSPEDFGVWDA